LPLGYSPICDYFKDYCIFTVLKNDVGLYCRDARAQEPITLYIYSYIHTIYSNKIKAADIIMSRRKLVAAT